MASSSPSNVGREIREQQLKAFEKLIDDTQVDLIRSLRTQFNSLYFEWEMVVFSSNAFSDPPPGKRNHNIPFELKKLFDCVPQQVAPSKRVVVVEFLSNAVNHLRLDNEDLSEVLAKNLEAENVEAGQGGGGDASRSYAGQSFGIQALQLASCCSPSQDPTISGGEQEAHE